LLQLVVLLAGTQRGLRLAWFVGVAALSNTLFKWLLAEPRPYWSSDTLTAVRATQGFGMPSGHAQGAMSLRLGLWIALGDLRRSGLLLIVILFILGTGVSRVYYGVHSVSQVLVGFALGLGLTLGLARALPALESALRQASLAARAGFAFVTLSVAWLLCLGVYQLRADFVPPAAWQTRFEATQLRLGHSGELGDMGLAPEGLFAGSIALVALLAGFAVLALIVSEWGHRVARSLKSRVQCIAVAIVVNLAVLYALRALSGLVSSEFIIWPVALWLTLQPLVALWLPLRFFGEPQHD
jgi:hypothetical protein